MEVGLALQELKTHFTSTDFATLQQKDKAGRQSRTLQKARGLVVVVARDSGECCSSLADMLSSSPRIFVQLLFSLSSVLSQLPSQKATRSSRS